MPNSLFNASFLRFERLQPPHDQLHQPTGPGTQLAPRLQCEGDPIRLHRDDPNAWASYQSNSANLFTLFNDLTKLAIEFGVLTPGGDPPPVAVGQ